MSPDVPFMELLTGFSAFSFIERLTDIQQQQKPAVFY